MVLDTLLLAENLYILLAEGYLLRGISLNYSASVFPTHLVLVVFVCVCL